MLGSAMLEVDLTEGHKTRRVVFSGDIGQWNKPIIHDPTLIAQADYLVMESTYGDRNHREAGDIATQLADVVNSTHRRGGNVVIPTFAVERAQELMYFFARLVQAQRIPPMKVYLDSPMAVDVTGIFAQHSDLFDADMNELIAAKVPPLRFPGLTMCRTAEESKRINEVREPCIIMASSGMCNAGRIKHHLRNNLPRSNATVLFVGYQAPGTLGQIIQSGAKEVRIHSELTPVRARIRSLGNYSAHADDSELRAWIKERLPAHGAIFLTHGEDEERATLRDEIMRDGGLSGDQVIIPMLDDAFELRPSGVVGVEKPAQPRIDPIQITTDWHNAYASFIIDLSHQLQNASNDRERLALMAELQSKLRGSGVSSAAPPRPIPPAGSTGEKTSYDE